MRVRGERAWHLGTPTLDSVLNFHMALQEESAVHVF